MSKEEKAKIARENGAKSQGPITEEGKAKSSRNALKSGEFATKLELFVPPHAAVLCNEDRQKFALLVDELIAAYRPANEPAFAIVKSIAIARWEIARLRACVTMHWNLALVEAAAQPGDLAPELIELQTMVRASTALYTGAAILKNLSRQIDQFENAITRLERRLKFLHATFPYTSEKRTQPDDPQPIENTEAGEEETAENEPPVVITENIPAVIEAYRKQYPNRKIIVMPADDVANGVHIEDDMPPAPRKAA